ncbi:hypothetical protein [Clostridium perfringens]|uniref:hypothetical protein n=1 Tax=Clostridium perfringens TaxID=1502 RepID=UPI001A348466|nr:hypothetical protein [Clostridium perfringens]HAT4245798.1 hypothetical protein [Clostridium perfringens]
MFRTLIYFDKKKITEYKSLIEKKKAVLLKKVKVSEEKAGNGKLLAFSGSISGKSEIDGEFLECNLLDCEEFENLLKEREAHDYFDFTEGSYYDIETIPKSSIIRFNATFNIPPDFDILELINKFRPMLLDSINLDSKEESEMLKSLLGKESTKMPIFIENEQDFSNRLGFAKINSNHLCCDVEELDDFENEEVTIIAKLVSRKNISSEPIIVYDVMKDLFSISRAIRRQFSSGEIEGIKNISIDESFVTLEILAIYR